MLKKITIILFSLAFASITISQSVTIKDSEETPNTLIEINDEGTAGSISLPSVGSSLGSGKLYNDGGDLYWGGDQIATGSSSGGYSVGDFALGGIIFWLDESGEHGLVCAKTDQNGGSTIRWYNGTATNTEAHGDGLFAGAMNTVLIIANQGSDSNTYAAGICANLQVTEGGKTYSDWYLPSIAELHLMYLNKGDIDITATANGGTAFATYFYWSSTETDSYLACLRDFSTGNQHSFNKALMTFVRAVRAF